MITFGSGICLFLREHHKHLVYNMTLGLSMMLIVYYLIGLNSDPCAYLTSIPDWLVWVKYLDFLHYAYESLVVNQWQYIDDIPGAGKTTLLNVLTARNLSKLRVKGVVLLNGQAVSAETMASLSSYIEQHELFHPLLTVREHLVFQSLLRMDRSLTRELKNFNLSKCMDTQIGGDFEFKGISGGEMKRLSFASEILSNVSLIDEPTTGLDSFMAQNIVQTLKTMASEGRTIVCTIHQPSSQVF
ncbi:unnamed protein product, partial [Medioppia subpectinata]